MTAPPDLHPDFDDELIRFAAVGAPPLPADLSSAQIEHEGASIWSADVGIERQARDAIVLLHGGLGHSGNWGHQLAALRDAGGRVIAIDSRGHGRSTRDDRPYSYELMAADVVAVLDARGVDRAILVGWSDGAVTALTVAMHAPELVAGVFFFGCAMNPDGLKAVDESDPLLGRCFGRHARDYAALSGTPDGFGTFVAAVNTMMRTQPDVAATELARVAVPVAIVQAERDEFVEASHADHLARTIPGATRVTLPGVTHFAPLQRPAVFNGALLDFIDKMRRREGSITR